MYPNLVCICCVLLPSPPTYLHFQIFPLISHQAQGPLPVTVPFVSTLFSLPVASLQVRPGKLEEIRISAGGCVCGRGEFLKLDSRDEEWEGTAHHPKSWLLGASTMVGTPDAENETLPSGAPSLHV